MHRPYLYIFIIQLILVVSGCSEGDRIDDTIDFTGSLQNCSNSTTNTFVFYKIDATNQQTIALNFTSDNFALDTVSEDTEPITITLDGSTNTVFYREFDTAINGDTYFCANVPPNGIVVTREFTGSDGSVEIRYTLIPENETDTTLSYTREIVLLNVTLIGPEITYRNEILVVGSDEITVAK